MLSATAITKLVRYPGAASDKPENRTRKGAHFWDVLARHRKDR